MLILLDSSLRKEQALSHPAVLIKLPAPGDLISLVAPGSEAWHWFSGSILRSDHFAWDVPDPSHSNHRLGRF